jgi:hypothetical protein
VLTRSQVVDLLKAAGQFCGVGLFTDEKGIAHLLSCATRTLRRWRDEGKGPPWKHTTRIVYDLDLFCDWYNSGETNNLTFEDKDGQARQLRADLTERAR